MAKKIFMVVDKRDKCDIFTLLKPHLFKVTDIKEIFGNNVDDKAPLRSFNNYELEAFGTQAEL